MASKGSAPVDFEYYQYLKQVLKSDFTDSDLFVATEKQFSQGPGISYPYRSFFYALGLMHEDKCRLKVGLRDFELQKGSLTMVGPGIIRTWLQND